ncbi:DUF2550 domain-containing protein [Gordonia amicalis]|uniref:DUF2550 domain-containing protein n=1 Tax=Gordonia amicalis TaxID=89053 RepID=A0ABU4DJ04_9ACTN|nr:DUF2550 domain-containing protein [Gordonia amicalis]MBA5847154.1 DUF2550 domain-containing protein [Gordonia amicalis]MCZ4577916.1 DUF2550 domain-containing protein [Gordonia amicalis]MDJ0452886.1 DUF2550 domain-containing protein [Gordonia amicalis]MDV6309727.1 DUF2550 domain-containing protein [Gordonia amicalis]MDV7075490.1 DUF2550 domain-containing protein [Gordonia amicalis]
MSLPVVLLSVLLAVAVIVCVLLAVRLAQLRRAGTPILLRTIPAEVDHGWRHGTAHYSDDSLRYYRLASLRPGPNVTLVRQGIEITGRRRPEGTETEILEGMLILQVKPSGKNPISGKGKDGYELAMGPGAVTAFQSWLESRQSARSERRKSA